MNKIVRRGALASSSMLLVSTLLFGPQAYANTLNDLKDEQKQMEQKKNELNHKIKESENGIEANQTKQDRLLNEILALNKEIVENEKSMDRVKNNIDITKKEIETLQEEIKELGIKIEDREQLLNDRARALQSNGVVSFIDVLIGSDSFIDFVDRFSAVNTIMEADRDIMKEQNEDKKSLETKKSALDENHLKLERDYSELVSLKNVLTSQKADKNTLIDQLEAEQEKLKHSKQQLEVEYEEAYEISEELEAKIIKEQQRMAELAREQENNKNSGSSNAVVPSSGTWTTPAYGRFTSGYGWRSFGGGEFHYGVDVANSIGTPIMAAADGIVSYAAPLSTYGNAVMLTHSINGEIYTSVYAHMSSIGVKAGQTVSKGQEIGKMGATGRVTGPHLHFELHIGTWAGQKVGHVNPLRYVPF
ncbi:murein hydrolase activator EnvC family protein [Lysinibacillus sp. LZ02]|uniref:murein hydrolase activator EnvC family protein n=1 Tax=Lysinibacillus sp. LZ02 TaxID=3420668 RepID=UPI003D36D937